jgi:hypothetical protein
MLTQPKYSKIFTMLMKTILAGSLTSLILFTLGCKDKESSGAQHHIGSSNADHSTILNKTSIPHDHNKRVAGPNGGKILTAPDFKNELFITDDRLVRITFLDDNNKPIAVGSKEVIIMSGDSSNSTNLNFSITDDGMSLISSNKLSEGINVPITITVKIDADAPPARARLNLNLADCSCCKYREYACVCLHDHAHDPGTGVPHDHDGDGKPDH